jgi:hypothetical protein
MTSIAKTAWTYAARKVFLIFMDHHSSTLKTHLRKATKEDEWWEPAAVAASRLGCGPGSLIYAVPVHMNDQPEDPYVEMHSTIFRSSGLIHRALLNYRGTLHRALDSLSYSHVLVNHEFYEKGPERIDESERLLAKLSLHYYKALLDTKMMAVGDVSDQIWDLVALNLCGKNPFLLASVARTPQFKALAYGNMAALCYRCPWHKDVWDGVLNGFSIDNAEAVVRQPVKLTRSFFQEKKFFEVWPVDPLQVPYEEPPHQKSKSPVMRITCNEFDPHTDSRLALEVERIKQKFR